VSSTDGNSGVSITRALLRGALGATFIAHGVRHGRTLTGTAGWFESIGFRHAGLQARASAVVEIASGAALLAGAATPVAASAVVATMAVAGETVHRRNGFFIVDEGYEYVATLATAAVALAALGPGRASVDRVLGIDDVANPLVRAAVAAAGLGAAAVQLRLFWQRPGTATSADGTG
jgi:putative oxidoreductase